MSETKRYFHGTHRTRPPEETLAVVAPFLEACGITRVADITGLDRIGLPVFTAFRPNARALATSQGKGVTTAAAKASAVMEAIEYHMAENPKLPILHGSLEDLANWGIPVAPLEALPRMTTEPIDTGLRTTWAEARDVKTDQIVQVPYELVHMDLTLPFAPSVGGFLRSSNGLASGNTRDEALIHAICELIERDALSIREMKRPAGRRIDPDTIPAGEADGVMQKLHDTGFHVGIWDITSDLGVPSYLASVTDPTGGEFYPAAGSGCHLDADVALSRALTEAVQTRLTYISGARDDQTWAGYEAARSSEMQAFMMSELEEPATHDFTDQTSLAGPDLQSDLETLIARLHDRDLPTPLWVDLSDPDMPVHVVRAFVPGLEGNHDAPGYVPGARARA